MHNLKRLGSALTLVLVLACATVAGETSAPPCAPGETSAPPCALNMASADPTALGETHTPPASESFDFLSLAETALALVF